MFEKLLSLVPYNPSLTHQLAFYSRRMREEASIRRIGLVFIVLTFMIQFFAVLSPPQATLASGDNDLVSGGITSAADAKDKCLHNVRHYGDIIHQYGLTCKAIGEASDLTLHSNAQDYYSMGWNPQGPTAKLTGEATHEQPANIVRDGKVVGTAYWRKLSSWDSYPNPGEPYHALRLTNSQGKHFYILFGCGNLVSVGIPAPVPPALGIELIPLAPGAGLLPTPTAVTTPTPTPTPVTPSVSTPMCQYNASLPATSPLCYQPCQYNSSLPATSQECKPCDKSISTIDLLACVSVHKSASNVTAGINDANNTTASPNDVINYTLYAENSGKADVKDYVFQEDLSDVLDYADATDFHGGVMDSSTKLVSWPAETLKAGETNSHEITVKVKATIPQTPASTSDPAHFDLTMTNVYGNAINIKLPGSPAQVVQTTAASLPNTGPGTSLFIGGLIVIVGGYFYGRARLLAKESALAVQQNAAA